MNNDLAGRKVSQIEHKIKWKEYNGTRIFHITTLWYYLLTQFEHLVKQYHVLLLNTTRGIMPKVAINDEHMCLNYGEKKKTWLFLQTLQLKLPNVVTQILRNKNKLRFKLECRNTLNIIISGQFNICTNFPSIVNLKTKIPMFDTLAIEDMFFW